MERKYAQKTGFQKIKISCIAFILCLFTAGRTFSQEHPRLILTKEGNEQIRKNLGEVPLFDASYERARKMVEKEMESGIEVPVPKDMAGGYTHERHKRNFLVMQKAGVLFQISGEEKYAIYLRDMLLEYARIYPTLPLHPQERSYARGKLFWQCLNDANWLVYASQAYDCIYDWLKAEERQRLESNLFRPYADFLSIENPQFYNRIHNHSAWGNAAVGMIGLVMNDRELVDRALYGIKNEKLDKTLKDDDGGLIKLPGQSEAGFLAQLDHLFSPDGYYTEGPYYQRYAMYPFMIFAGAIENCRPDLKIFTYRDSLLSKAVYALLNLTDVDGEFFPINDAQKGMSYLSRELVSSVDMVYHLSGHDPSLLSIAELQQEVTLDDAGFSVALDIKKGRSRPFLKKTIELRDGSDGSEGGIGILRMGAPSGEINLVMKYSAQGLGHGHFDKLSFSLYDSGQEVIQDYGLARFVNIEQKNGGGYLKENTTFAKQSIAHNALVVNQKSHFLGSFEEGNKHHSDRYFFDGSREDIRITSAKDQHAYPGVKMHRTMALAQLEGLQNPVAIDVLRVTAEKENTYDLPFYYQGQFLTTNFDYQVFKSLYALGKDHGYQHLWREAEGQPQEQLSRFQWLLSGKFYTLTTLLQDPENTGFVFGRAGAHDPDFNLRRDPVFIIRNEQSKDVVFVSVIEPHGSYSPVSEIASNAFSGIKTLELVQNDDAYTAVRIENVSGTSALLIIANKHPEKGRQHQQTIRGKQYRWSGPYYYTKEL